MAISTGEVLALLKALRGRRRVRGAGPAGLGGGGGAVTPIMRGWRQEALGGLAVEDDAACARTGGGGGGCFFLSRAGRVVLCNPLDPGLGSGGRRAEPALDSSGRKGGSRTRGRVRDGGGVVAAASSGGVSGGGRAAARVAEVASLWYGLVGGWGLAEDRSPKRSSAAENSACLCLRRGPCRLAAERRATVTPASSRRLSACARRGPSGRRRRG
jgi:hypothetical protein